MDGDELRSMQAPIKDRYREEPEAALVTLRADGELGPQELSCSVQTGRALVAAGLHPASGGDGSLACSGDMLLQALVACAGVTLASVATNRGIDVRGFVRAEGDLDFRGTMGVDREAPGRLLGHPTPLRRRERRQRRGPRRGHRHHRALLRRVPDPGQPAGAQRPALTADPSLWVRCVHRCEMLPISLVPRVLRTDTADPPPGQRGPAGDERKERSMSGSKARLQAIDAVKALRRRRPAIFPRAGGAGRDLRAERLHQGGHAEAAARSRSSSR